MVRKKKAEGTGDGRTSGDTADSKASEKCRSQITMRERWATWAPCGRMSLGASALWRKRKRDGASRREKSKRREDRLSRAAR